MMCKRTTLAAALVIWALAAALPSYAQTADTPDRQDAERAPWWGWEPGMMGWGPGMRRDGYGLRGSMMRGAGFGRGRMMGGPAQFIEGRIAFLRAELDLTDQQKPLFDAYAKALRETAASMQAIHDRMWSRDIPERLPERLQWRIDIMTTRVKALENMKAAALPLYEALSPEQKEQADRLIGPMGMM
jgi:hypothetical protein